MPCGKCFPVGVPAEVCVSMVCSVAKALSRCIAKDLSNCIYNVPCCKCYQVGVSMVCRVADAPK